MDSKLPNNLASAREQVRARAAKLGAYFQNTEDGKLLLKALEEEFFDGDLYDSSPEKTFFNLGAREVVRYIRHLRDAAKGT